MPDGAAEFVFENFVWPGLRLLCNVLIAKSVCARMSNPSSDLPSGMIAVLMDETNRLNARNAIVDQMLRVKSSARCCTWMDRHRKTLTGMELRELISHRLFCPWRVTYANLGHSINMIRCRDVARICNWKISNPMRPMVPMSTSASRVRNMMNVIRYRLVR